jgi:threonine dehydrogenase-like Zn-dependent dehydrogenase
MVKLPDEIDDDEALMISDIFPTGYFGAHLAEIKPGNTVAVFGCGPVGQFAITSAMLMDAGRVIAIDHVPSRLEMAKAQGAETINFESENPVDAIRWLTGGIGVDRAIDAVGVDAEPAQAGPAAQESQQMRPQFEQEMREIGQPAPSGQPWHPGGAPSQATVWAVESLAKAGTLSVIGVYPKTMRWFPLGMAMNKNLTVNMGNCNHRKYIPILLELVQTGQVKPGQVLTSLEPLTNAIDAYRAFDERRPGWIKVELAPAAVA